LLSKCEIYYAGYSEDRWDFVLIVGDCFVDVSLQKQIMLLSPKVFKLMVISCSYLEPFDDLVEWFMLLVSRYLMYDLRFRLWNALIKVFNYDSHFRVLCRINQQYFKELYSEEDMLINIMVPKVVLLDSQLCGVIDKFSRVMEHVVVANSFLGSLGLEKMPEKSKEVICYDDAKWRILMLARLSSFKCSMRNGNRLIIRPVDTIWMKSINWNLRLFYFVFGEFIRDFNVVPIFKRIKSLMFISGRMVIRYVNVVGFVKFRVIECDIDVEGGAILKLYGRKQFLCLFCNEWSLNGVDRLAVEFNVDLTNSNRLLRDNFGF